MSFFFFKVGLTLAGMKGSGGGAGGGEEGVVNLGSQ